MQTVYESQDIPGVIADARVRVVESYAATAEIPAGAGVVKVADETVKVAAASTDVFRGVAVAGTSGEKYAATDMVSVLRKGTVKVAVVKAVAADAVAYVDVTTAGKIGQFTDAANNGGDPAVANLATGGKFRKTTTGAGVSVLEINL